LALLYYLRIGVGAFVNNMRCRQLWQSLSLQERLFGYGFFGTISLAIWRVFSFCWMLLLGDFNSSVIMSFKVWLLLIV
jgi:hypothetical protein